MLPLETVQGFTEAELNDPVFRLTCGRIYMIRNQDGEPEWFRPKPEQLRIIRMIYLDGAKVLVIPKARQIGMSTLIALIILDTIIWSTSVQTTLIDYNGDNARKKMVEKVIYAYDRLPPAIAALTSIRTKNTQTGEFAVGPNVAFCTEEEAKMRSTAFFGDQPRGGTNQILWLSEWAEIAARFPQRSQDIKTGALSSAKRGLIIIETTWHGGKRGDVWPFVKAALETLPQHRTNRTPALQFFAWWTDPNNRVAGSPDAVRPETLAYFTEVKQLWPKELAGVNFNHEQMLWYQEEWTKLGIHMRGQNPTVLEECFQAIIKGAIWAAAIAKARQDGRITNVPHDPSLEVDTFWDLGSPTNTSIKFVQHRGGWHNLIASQRGGWSLVPDLVRSLKTRGYKYHIHFLPHDGAQTDRGGATFEQLFRDELAKQDVSGQIVIIPRASSVWPGVNHMTAMFNTTLIDLSCKEFIDAAENYRRRPDPVDDTRPDPVDDTRFTDDIVKDWTSHECLDGSTLIETQRGPVPIAEMTTADKVRIGDVLADVEWVGPTKFSEVIELQFDDGSKLLASPSHYLFSSKGLSRCDTMRINDVLWTPSLLLSIRLTDSPFGARKAFSELSMDGDFPWRKPAITSTKPTKVITGLRRLPPRQLYDMTVPQHHCYVANGVLVSNCDSIRYMAEADIHGYLPGTGAAVAVRPYFDPETLKAASHEAAATPARLFNLVCSDRPGTPVRRVAAIPHDYGGWLRVWEQPQNGHSYVLSLIGRALQMWRCDLQGMPLALAAAPSWQGLVDYGIIYRLAAQMSAYYGLAPIALDVLSHPGGVKELEALGANLIPRMQLEGRRPLGQEEPIEHAGWEWKPEVAQHAMVGLQTRVRQSRIVLRCPALIAQCAEITNDLEGRPTSRATVPVDLVYGAALACACHDFGSSYRPPSLEVMGGGYRLEPQKTTGRMKNR